MVCDMGDLAQTVTKHKYFKTDAETLACGLKAGIDAFNDVEEVVIAAAKEALKNGLIKEEDIDRAIRNTFATKLRLGMYDLDNRSPYSDIDIDVLNCQKHREICLEVAKKAVVLLKNENKLLPIKSDTREKIAVIGPLGDAWYKDWYCGVPLSKVTPWEGLKGEFTQADLFFTDGIDRIRIKMGDQYLAVKQDGTCYLSDLEAAESFEHTDWGDNKHTLRASSTMKYLSTDSDTGYILANQEEVFSWFVQEVFSFKKIDYKTEDTNRCFVLESWDHKPLYIGNDGILSYDVRQVGTEFFFEVIEEGIQHAAEYAKAADKVIAIMGCHPIICCKEDSDRSNLTLPPMQRKLLQKIKQVNPNVILVLITNYPYDIEWEKEKLPAILMTASGSQELGTAIAGAVAGKFSPSGRLNMTWYQNDGQLPSMREYDIIHARRTYLYFKEKVLYPFGYGLTYTDFLYHDLKVIQEPEKLMITLQIKNVGSCDSDEVVQLYISQLHSRTLRPLKQLKGFERVFIKAGEDRSVEFELSYKELEYYDVVTSGMLIEDSDYMVCFGSGSQDIRLETKVYINGTIISCRDMTKEILCDHYDDYENIYLDLGHNGKPCILPKSNDEQGNILARGVAVYHNALFLDNPSEFVIDMKSEEPGSVIVWFGNTKLSAIDCSEMKNFEVMKVPVITKEIDLGVTKPLRVEIIGRQRVIGFSFR